MIYIIISAIISAIIILLRGGMKDAIITAIVGVLGVIALAANLSWLWTIILSIVFLVAYNKLPKNKKGMDWPQTTLCLLVSILLITCKLEWTTVSLLVGLVGGVLTIWHAWKV